MEYLEFERILSAKRMQRYKDAANGDTRKAMALYRYNLRLSQEMFTIVSCFEVALRNAIDSLLVPTLGENWLKDSVQDNGIFSNGRMNETRKIIEKAYNRLNRQGIYSHSKLIAEMEFGVWKYMYSSLQYRVTGQCLLRAFPNKPRSSAAIQYNNTYIFNELDKVNSYLSDFTELTSKSRILEVGCGEGGNLVPFAQLGCKVTGIDVAECRIKDAKAYFSEICNHATFVCCDFMQYPVPCNEEDKYDVILLHDVIEHVPTKELFLVHLRKFLKTKGVLFVGFPAWQMPFGGHQQICRSKLCSHLPFIHLLSNPLYKLLLKTCNEEKGTINELMSIKDCRTSIELFERLIHQCGFSVTDQKLWFINPHYKQKFHLTPRLLPHWVWRVKYIRNFFTTSCWYVLSIGNKEKF